MAWMYLIGAGLAEIVWATMMKFTDGFTRPWPTTVTIAFMVISFELLSLALKELPMSTAYAVWVGIGAVGVAIVGMAFMNEPVTLLKLGFLGMIVAGIVGLKLVTV
jgi:quaternary ammonium compound-resistance protein SugE